MSAVPRLGVALLLHRIDAVLVNSVPAHLDVVAVIAVEAVVAVIAVEAVVAVIAAGANVAIQGMRDA